MAVDNFDIIDGIGLQESTGTLVMLLTDHFEWNGPDALSEYDHLIMLQEKLNSYVNYYINGFFREEYPDADIGRAVIEIHFKYDTPDVCESFLNAVQEQTETWGIFIKAQVD